MKILFVDDLKLPEMYLENEDCYWAQSGEEALDMWRTGLFDTIYLDNDLGWGPEGHKILVSMIEIKMPKAVYSITYNPVARKRMMDICEQFGIEFHIATTVMDRNFWE